MNSLKEDVRSQDGRATGCENVEESSSNSLVLFSISSYANYPNLKSQT